MKKTSRKRPPSGRSNGKKKSAVARTRESQAAKRLRGLEVVRRLKAEYPDARCSLDYQNPFQLLVATILSAQCTDERVNQVTPTLFGRYPRAQDLADARVEDVEELIKSTGFFRNKTRSLLGMSNALVDHHAGQVPDQMADLVELPGVGRKTANVVLGNAFDKAEGVVVDTHVTRLSGRLGFTKHREATLIEADLMKLIPREDWTLLAHLFIYHGRAVCKAPIPRCERCVLNDICPSSRV